MNRNFKMFVYSLCLGVVGLGIAENALSSEERLSAIEEKLSSLQPSISFDIGSYTKYIWRGWNLFNDPVYQGGIGIQQGGITASVWGNYALGDTDRLTELDFTLDFTHSFGLLSASLGYIKYTFPNVPVGFGRESSELYTGLSLDIPTAPSITAYYDYGPGDGTYVESSISHSVEIGSVEISPSIALGYNDHQWRAEGSGFSNLLPSLSVSYPVKSLTLSATWGYSIGLDSDYGFDRDFGYGGINLNAGF